MKCAYLKFLNHRFLRARESKFKRTDLNALNFKGHVKKISIVKPRSTNRSRTYPRNRNVTGRTSLAPRLRIKFFSTCRHGLLRRDRRCRRGANGATRLARICQRGPTAPRRPQSRHANPVVPHQHMVHGATELPRRVSRSAFLADLKGAAMREPVF